MKFNVTPCLTMDQNNNASGALRAKLNHNNTDYHVMVTDAARDGDILNSLKLGMKNDNMMALFDLSNNHSVFRFNQGLRVRDRDIALKYTHVATDEHRTFLNASMTVDDNNTARVIYEVKAGERPSHRNATLGWRHVRDDLEIEPRYNLGTESLSAAVAYRVDDENKLRGIFDMHTNHATLQWTNSGALGGGGETRITARATMDQDGMKQMPTMTIEKTWDLDM